MFLATIDFIPNKKYEILGVVIGSKLFSFSKNQFNLALNEAQKKAKELGADGLIGIRTSITLWGATTVVATAIKFI